MPFFQFLKIVLIVYAGWYMLNILIDLIKGGSSAHKKQKKQSVQIIGQTDVTSVQLQDDDTENTASAPDPTIPEKRKIVDVSIENLQLEVLRELAQENKRRTASPVTDLGIEITEPSGIPVYEFTRQNIEDYELA